MGYKIMSHIGRALGNVKVDNDYYLNQMEESQREGALHFYNDVLGRDIRYIVDDTQTSLSLAIDASKEAILENNVDVQDIGMIICVTYTPEYSAPSMARLILEELDGKETTICLDMNTNCTGMLIALDMADRYFRTDDSLKKILVVQGDCNSRVKSEITSPFFGCLSDIGCAIILERDEESGIQSRHFITDQERARTIVYPKDGHSKPNPIQYALPDADARIDLGANLVKKYYSREKIDGFKVVCISQFAYNNYRKFLELVDIPKEKAPYIGDQYGYTGASSPILALKQAVEECKIKRGDSFLLWTYGAGTVQVVLEMKY